MKYGGENIESDNFNKKGKRKVAEDFTTNVKKGRATLTLWLKLKVKEVICLDSQVQGNSGVSLGKLNEYLFVLFI
jgi:hypothetical protein